MRPTRHPPEGGPANDNFLVEGKRTESLRGSANSCNVLQIKPRPNLFGTERSDNIGRYMLCT